jgi:hypothetical protein
VFQDATRTAELHVIKGLPHADGMLVLCAAEGKRSWHTPTPTTRRRWSGRAAGLSPWR